MDDSGHHTKTMIPVSIPTVPQLRPVLEAISRGSSPILPEQLAKTSDQQGNNRGAALTTEPKHSPGRVNQQDNLLVQQPFQANPISSPLHVNSLTLNSRSLSLKHGYHHGNKSQLPTMHSEGLVCNPMPSMFPSSNVLANRSNSVSYDSLINPGDAHLLAQRGVPSVAYHTHFMTMGPDGTVMQRSSPHAYSPVFMGVSRQSPQPRDPSPSLQGLASRDNSPSFQGLIQRDHSPSFQGLIPRDFSPQGMVSRAHTPPGLALRNIQTQSMASRELSPQGLTPQQSPAARYDTLTKNIMASIQERRELEERERMLRMHARSQAIYGPDASVYDIPVRRSLPPDGIRPMGSRGPTPPAYGSREFLMSTGILGYGLRSSPLSSCSASSLSRGPKTSSSPLQSSSSGSLQSKARSSSPAFCASDRQTQALPMSTATLPRIPSTATSSATTSYGTAKRPSLTYNSEGKDSTPVGGLN